MEYILTSSIYSLDNESKFIPKRKQHYNDWDLVDRIGADWTLQLNWIIAGPHKWPAEHPQYLVKRDWEYLIIHPIQIVYLHSITPKKDEYNSTNIFD